MGRGRKTRNYRELREQFDEAERRAGEEVEGDEDEEEDEDEDEDEEEEEEAEAEGDEEEDVSDEEEDEDGIVRKKKKKKKVKVKEKVVKPRAKRTRASKVTRMKVVWGVFSNSNQRVATYEYKQKEDALAHAERLTAAKPNNTHFVQPVKEPFEPKE